MKPANDSTPTITVAVIEDGLFRVALAMERAGKRGEVYLPIYERLESELAALKAKQASMERALDAWRRKQDDLPGRPEAIRRLVDIALKAKK